MRRSTAYAFAALLSIIAALIPSAIFADLLVPVSEWENWSSPLGRARPRFNLVHLPPVLRAEMSVYKVLVVPPGWVAAKATGSATVYAAPYVTPRDIGETAGVPPFFFAVQHFRWALPVWFAILVVTFEGLLFTRRRRAANSALHRT